MGVKQFLRSSKYQDLSWSIIQNICDNIKIFLLQKIWPNMFRQQISYSTIHILNRSFLPRRAWIAEISAIDDDQQISVPLSNVIDFRVENSPLNESLILPITSSEVLLEFNTIFVNLVFLSTRVVIFLERKVSEDNQITLPMTSFLAFIDL